MADGLLQHNVGEQRFSVCRQLCPAIQKEGKVGASMKK